MCKYYIKTLLFKSNSLYPIQVMGNYTSASRIYIEDRIEKERGTHTHTHTNTRTNTRLIYETMDIPAL